MFGQDENKFWTLTPKTIKKYFDAFAEQRRLKQQDLYIQAEYIAAFLQGLPLAVVGMTDFKKYKLPKLPDNPYQKREEVKDENWIKRERIRAYNSFYTFLSRGKKIQEEV